MKLFELPTISGRSFSHKVIVIEKDNGTTMRRINAFLAFYGIEGGGKAWWNSLEVA